MSSIQQRIGDKLSPIDQLMPKGYIRQILAFPSSNSKIFDTLKASLATLVESVPYLAGHIVEQEYPRGSVAFRHHHDLLGSNQDDGLLAKVDLSESLDYAELKEQGFPPHLLVDARLIPKGVRSSSARESHAAVPVFRSVLAEIKNGVLLTVCVHHSSADVTGFGTLLQLWASCCRTGSSGITAELVDKRWVDRSQLEIPFKSGNTSTCSRLIQVPHRDHLSQSRENDRPARLTDYAFRYESTAYSTSIFYFSTETLIALKLLANVQLAQVTSDLEYVTTNDVLTALLWSAVVSAEDEAGHIRTETVKNNNFTIGMPVNFRSRLKPALPTRYIGAAFAMTSASSPLPDLLGLARTSAELDINVLARIAASVRKGILQIDSSSVTELLRDLTNTATLRVDDLREVKLGPPNDGISIVSWADEGVYSLDWGPVLGGRCEAVRVPKLKGRRYPIILPRVPAPPFYESDGDVGRTASGDDGFEVLVSLETNVMELLKKTTLIKQYANLRCCG